MNSTEKIGFLFDLDGVLIDSETEYTRIWSEIESTYPTGIDNFARVIKGQTLPEILGHYFPDSLHEDVVAMLYDKEQKMKYNYLPGAFEILSYLNDNGMKCVLVTSSNEMKMKHLREERPELESFFEDIVTADKISRSKPDPEGYLLGASILGCSPVKCAVFEDSRQGVKAGRAAGSYVIGLTTTLSKEEIMDFCDETISNLAEIKMDKLTKTLLKR